MKISLIIFLQYLGGIVCLFDNISKYFPHALTTKNPPVHENQVKFFRSLD
jgi:uncharacterized protein YneF (UPF0154 family)